MGFFEDLTFRIKKPKVIIIAGEERARAKAVIFSVLGSCFKIGKEVLIYDTDLKDPDKIKFLIRNSALPVLVVTNVGEIPSDKDFFTGDTEKVTGLKKISEILPKIGQLLVNFDDEAVRMIKNETKASVITFGFQDGAGMRASDIAINGEVNFKINYEGSTVPFWLTGKAGKKEIYAALSAAACGISLGLNLVQISQILKSYKS